jgi:hypothetical protein
MFDILSKEERDERFNKRHGIVAKNDVISFRVDETYCECEDECDCEVDVEYTILINGQTGYGYAQWVQDERNNELLAVTFLGGQFECQDYAEMCSKIERSMSAFQNVEVDWTMSSL